MSEEMMEGADLITLVDDDGQEHEFEIIDSVEQPDGSEYVALVPVFGDGEEAEDSGELIILKVVEEEGGEEILEAIEDDEEFDRIGAVFKERLKDAFDFEE